MILIGSGIQITALVFYVIAGVDTYCSGYYEELFADTPVSLPPRIKWIAIIGYFLIYLAMIASLSSKVVSTDKPYRVHCLLVVFFAFLMCICHSCSGASSGPDYYARNVCKPTDNT